MCRRGLGPATLQLRMPTIATPMELRCSTATGRPGHAIFITLFTDKALVRVDTTAQITDRWELPGALGPFQTTTINGDVWVADPTIDTVYRIRPHCD